jgi:hypothetical protein
MNRFIIFCSSICLLGGHLVAYDEPQENCANILLISYFPESVVNQVLSEYQVSQDLWPAINADLAKQDDVIISIVEKKAASMEPNPLYDVNQKNVAVNVYRQSLFEVFSQTMNKYGIDRRERIEAMLDEIQYKKGKLYNDCMQKKQKALELTPDENY